ncbi:MAG: nucleotidyltransferase family protein [gamma proteobacterium symbiont of Taylorina sp.]|nr:nucleotidyltransferase family protein [gamma proteobacterium symbiont of Taylorina sp.]
MKALLLSAGFGTRLRPLTETIPKCLVPIAGKPLLAYWLELLMDAGITEILINTHYLSEQVESFIECSPFKDKVTLVYEAELLHTGGTLLKNSSFFDNTPFLVIHADNFSHCNFRQFIQAHIKRPDETIATMMTFNTSYPKECGVIKKNKQGIMTGFFEKIDHPPSHIANGAVYVFEPEIFDLLLKEEKNIIDLSTDIIPKLIGKMFTFHNNQCHIDIGTMKNYQLACEYVTALSQKNIL